MLSEQMNRTSENVPSDMCAQRRFRSACTFAQSDENLQWAHFSTANDAKFLQRTTKADQTGRTCPPFATHIYPSLDVIAIVWLQSPVTK